MPIDFNIILQTGGESIEINEPAGFDEIELSLKRDDKMHGMTFEASTSALQFYGDAADFLREQKKQFGLKADVVFIASQKCGDGVYDEYEELIKGRLNFGKYKEKCGETCLVILPIETETCEVTFKNRFDQKVNIDINKGFDGFTVLPGYSGLNLVKELPAKELFVATIGQVALGGYAFNLGQIVIGTNPVILVRPVFGRAQSNSIDTGQLEAVESEYGLEGAIDIPVSPILLFEDLITCFSGEFEFTIRLKGSYNFSIPSTSITVVRVLIMQTDDPTTASPNQTTYLSFDLPHSVTTASGTFDQTFTGTINITEGYGIYAVFGIAAVGITSTITGSITWDEETSVSITANKSCPPTDADLYLVHETLSRATEAITDYCMRVKSEYYGRIDSEPFAFDNDGCGGLRFFTSGLKIRKAIEDNFFASLKDLIVDGLQPIDNIGMGVEPDLDREGNFLLRIEGLDFFYTNEEILYHDAIPLADHEIDESKHYSLIKVGYKKWEVQRINGLDEFNSNREYRTSLSSVSNPLDITSSLIAGGYPLEVTRQQSFADSGGADTSYDNEIFILTGTRGVYGVEPEQNNIIDPANIYSPLTAWNFRLSPLRNLMRWYRSIINSYSNIIDSANKLFFGSGTGNLIAEGMVTPGTYDSHCILEKQVIKENQNLFTSHFARTADYTPLFRNETITYSYSMSIEDYRKVKLKPYGYIRYQCGANGSFEKGYIKEIKYKPLKGMATFILKKKW